VVPSTAGPGAQTPRSAGPPALAYAQDAENAVAYWLECWRALCRNWRWMAAVTASGALLGLLVTVPQKRIYQARSVLEIQGFTDNVLKAQDGNPNAGAEIEISDLQTQIRIMASETLLDLVCRKLMARRGPAGESAIREARKSLVVRPIQTTRLIEILTKSTDPGIAAEFANQLGTEYIAEHIDARWQGTERAAGKMARALDEMRGRLERSEDGLQDYARKSGLLLTSDHSDVSGDRLKQIQGEYSRAQAERVGFETRNDAVRLAEQQELPGILNDGALNATQEKITELRRQLAELSTTYTGDYPKVKRVEAQIEPLEKSFHSRVAELKTQIRTNFEEAAKREQLLKAAFEKQAGAVSEEAGRRIHYDILRHEVDSTRTLYETMLVRVKEAGIASALRGSNVRVLDPAKVPGMPFQPKPVQSVLLGTLVGLVMGSFFAISRERTDRTIQSPGEITSVLELPEFGTVPTASVERFSESPLELAAIQPDRPLLSASFRSILTSLLFARREAGPCTVVLTSANPGEGKTTVAANLALALSEVGQRVVLIDADLRRPRLHTVFESPIAPGFSDLLTDRARIPQAIRATAFANLSLLPAGAEDPAATALLYSSRLRDILEYCRKNFDIVLLDTPPMLQIADARVIGRVADSVVLVIRAGKTTREAALAARQRLAEDGTPMNGCVLNDWNPRKSPGGYYGQRTSVLHATSARG
jgi:succinoglycan biosynthesis transport protein ExoP